MNYTLRATGAKQYDGNVADDNVDIFFSSNTVVVAVMVVVVVY